MRANEPRSRHPRPPARRCPPRPRGGGADAGPLLPVAAVEAVGRLIDPQPIDHLVALAAAGVVGFLGNELAAIVRLRAGRRLRSPALVADGYHARTDGLVSLAVVLSAGVVAVGAPVADPLIGLVIAVVILRITWQSFQTVRAAPGTRAATAHEPAPQA